MSPLVSLTIRQLKLTDTAGLYQLIKGNHDRLLKWFPITLQAIKDEASALAYIQKRHKMAEQRIGFYYALEDSATQQLIGALILKSIDWQVPKCELAYYIDRNYEGRGITSFGIEWLCDLAFKKWGMNKIFLRIGPTNLASVRIAEKTGFIQEGLIRQDFRTHTKEIVDIAYYGLTRNDWESKKE